MKSWRQAISVNRSPALTPFKILMALYAIKLRAESVEEEDYG
jgi:hypothetical protein